MEQTQAVVAEQRDYYQTGATRSLTSRRSALESLRQSIKRHEDQILEALATDLGKNRFEGYSSELFTVLEEINFIKSRLRRWARPRRVPTSIVSQPGKSRIIREPYGVVAVLSPWNYPVLLALSPLVGAIAAGNCVVIKPSEFSRASAGVIETVISSAFDPRHVRVVQGEADVAKGLIDAPPDFVFFTGGTEIGRKVYQSAAGNLTPVVLELGGKSPCIVDATADLPIAGRRIAWGKLLNAGQTCVAPDYLCVTRDGAPALIEALGTAIEGFFGAQPMEHPDFGLIVNQRHYARLTKLVDEALKEPESELLIGGGRDPDRRAIAPTVIRVSPKSVLMKDELFGPILPVVVVDTPEEAFAVVADHPDPLAAYLFSNDPEVRRRFEKLRFGGGVINDTVVHLATPRLPFGGIGSSGFGSYHGRESFELFSRPKSLLIRRNRPDVPLRYPPYGNRLKLLKRLFPG